MASAEPSAPMRWRCAVCGGPLVPSDGSFPRANGELASLVGSARARAMAVGWAAAAAVLAAVGLLTLPLALLLWSASHVAGLILTVVAGAAVALAAASALRSRARGAEARAKLDEAWRTVADELLHARGAANLTAPELARALQTDEAHAEALLSGLSVEGHARVAVDDDAQLSYRFAAEAEGAGSEAAEAPPAAQPARRTP
jgi:hypothetical protein